MDNGDSENGVPNGSNSNNSLENGAGIAGCNGDNGQNFSSNNSNSGCSSTSNGNLDDVCRDYLRNVCRRGKNCRFKHPDSSTNDQVDSLRKDLHVFCHDFQNRECRRENCRFIHCSKQEEEMYRSTGKLPSLAQGLPVNIEEPISIKEAPICKDFTNGYCRRQQKCKFRHPQDSNFYQASNRNSFDSRNGGQGYGAHVNINPPARGPYDYSSRYGRDDWSDQYGRYNGGYAEGANKRKRPYEPMYSNTSSYNPHVNNQLPPHMLPYGQPPEVYYPRPNEGRSYLEEENIALRRRIDELKKQVSELVSANEYLQEQYNILRSVQSVSAPVGATVAVATSVPSLVTQQTVQTPGVSTSAMGIVGNTQLSQSVTIQTAVPPGPASVPTGTMLSGLPPSSMVTSIASISIPTVSAPVSIVDSSGATTLVSYTPSTHATINAWQLSVDQ